MQSYTAEVVRKILDHGLLYIYLFLATLAVHHAVTGKWMYQTPGYFEYSLHSMSDVFTSYSQSTSAFIIEGMDENDIWQPIDVNAYFPYMQAEQLKRLSYYSYYNNRDFYYRQMAKQLRRHEAEKGRAYSSIRFAWEYWPSSPLGLEEEHTKNQTGFTEIAVIHF